MKINKNLILYLTPVWLTVVFLILNYLTARKFVVFGGDTFALLLIGFIVGVIPIIKSALPIVFKIVLIPVYLLFAICATYGIATFLWCGTLSICIP